MCYLMLETAYISGQETKPGIDREVYELVRVEKRDGVADVNSSSAQSHE